MRLTLNQKIIIATVLGLSLGIYFNHLGVQNPTVSSSLYFFDLISGVFVNLLKMILTPLIFTSIVVGIANLRLHHQMKKVWQVTVLYFLFTVLLAVTLGLVMVNIVKPGVGLQMAMFQDAMQNYHGDTMTIQDFLKKFLSELFLNPVAAMAQGQVLATVTFAIFLGVAMVAVGERAKTIFNFLSELYELLMRMVGWIMELLPFALVALLAKMIGSQDIGLLKVMGKFIALVVGLTLFHGFVTLPGTLFLLTKMSPLKFFKGAQEAMLTAFSTSSSNATLPITIRSVTENFGVDKNIVGFVAPLGATVNMDGTALYEAVAALFVANLAGVHLNIVQQIMVAFTAIIAAIGAPGIPSAGMVTMIMVLQSVGLPVEAIAILLPIDRFLDTFRTMVNVEGDITGSIVVQHYVNKNTKP